MASSRFAYPLQPLLNVLVLREKAARLNHARAALALDLAVRELVALERCVGLLTRVFEHAAPAWHFGEVDRRLARLEAGRAVRLGEIAAARSRIESARAELVAAVGRRQALERHRARSFERHRRELDAVEEAELEEAQALRRGSPLDGCEQVSA